MLRQIASFLLLKSTVLADPAPEGPSPGGVQDIFLLFPYVHIDMLFSPTHSGLGWAEPSRVVTAFTPGARSDVYSVAFLLKYLSFPED